MMNKVRTDETGTTSNKKTTHVSRLPAVLPTTRPELADAAGIGETGDHAWNYPCGRHGIAAASHHAGCVQAAGSGVRQADDLLPAVDSYHSWNPRHPHHHDAAGPCAVRAALGRRVPTPAE